MKVFRTLIITGVVWLVVITLLHGRLKLHLFEHKKTGSAAKFRVGFLPVTFHLTCPVTDFINRSTTGDNFYEPLRF